MTNKTVLQIRKWSCLEYFMQLSPSDLCFIHISGYSQQCCLWTPWNRHATPPTSPRWSCCGWPTTTEHAPFQHLRTPSTVNEWGRSPTSSSTHASSTSERHVRHTPWPLWRTWGASSTTQQQWTTSSHERTRGQFGPFAPNVIYRGSSFHGVMKYLTKIFNIDVRSQYYCQPLLPQLLFLCQ